MYMTGFQCNVTNPSKRNLLKSAPPVRCDGQRPCYLYPNYGNVTNSCPRAKQPIYWANNERNNVANPSMYYVTLIIPRHHEIGSVRKELRRPNFFLCAYVQALFLRYS